MLVHALCRNAACNIGLTGLHVSQQDDFAFGIVAQAVGFDDAAVVNHGTAQGVFAFGGEVDRAIVGHDGPLVVHQALHHALVYLELG